MQLVYSFAGKNYHVSREILSKGLALSENTWKALKCLEEFVNYSPAARDLQILLVFCQHPEWFISLYIITKSMRAL